MMHRRARFWSGPLIALVVCQATVHASGELRVAEAVKNHDIATVRALVKRGVDVNTPQPDGATALHWAAHWDDVETADLLLRAGAKVNVANDYGVTPLSLACTNGGAALIEKLLGAGADPNAATATGETPLMTAARTGRADAVERLLAHGAAVNGKETVRAQTALMWAVAEGHTDVVRLLLRKGADIHARSTAGFTAVLFAAREGMLDSAQALVDAGADANDTAVDGVSALVVASVRDHIDLARLLLDWGADPNADGAGYSALHWAAGSWDSELPEVFGRNEALAKVLLTHGANPNARIVRAPPQFGFVSGARIHSEVRGATPFFLAAMAGEVGIMRALAAAGADLQLTTIDHTTPLMVAAGLGRIVGESRVPENLALEAVTIALASGADVNAANDAGETALHGAAFAGVDPVVRLLVDKGAKLNVKNKAGQTPLNYAEGGAKSGTTVVVNKTTAALLRELGGGRP